jgi:hypothetical protein
MVEKTISLFPGTERLIHVRISRLLLYHHCNGHSVLLTASLLFLIVLGKNRDGLSLFSVTCPCSHPGSDGTTDWDGRSDISTSSAASL